MGRRGFTGLGQEIGAERNTNHHFERAFER